MVEHSGIDIRFLNKYCPSTSSSSSSSDREKKILSTLKDRLSKKYPQKNGEVLSAQYGINLLLIGLSLMLARSNQESSVTEEILLAFLTTLMLVQLLWMFCYITRRERRRSLPPERDANTATSWIRGGLTMLALLSLIMDAFRIGNFIGYQACVSPMLGVYPVVHALHTVSQVHFLWFHIKDVIKRYETFERFGVIHAVFTNLLLWSNAVMTEAEHALNDHKKRLAALGYFNVTVAPEEPNCTCSSSACSMFSSSLYYLCPFNIEYHIFVSALLFVMWKNIGRTLEQQTQEKTGLAGGSCLLLGPLLGLLALASSITVLVIYIIHVEETPEARESAISMFYDFGMVILACMSAAAAAGLLIYRVEDWPMDTASNPARTLDAKLLLASSVGAWLLCWCSVVAACGARRSPAYRWTSLAYSLLLVLEKCVQNLFIVESLYRRRWEPGERSAHGPTHSSAHGPTHSSAHGEIFSVAVPMAPPYDGIVNHAYEMEDKHCRVMEKSHTDVRGHSSNQRGVALSIGRRRQDTPSWKRQVLKNIAIFLFMCNISLWVLPAFGCRPQFDNGLEEAVFGFSIWSAVLNFALPMSLCYRMHSVAALFEVFHKI